MEWIKYSDRKPEVAGVYLWRMGSRKVKGLVIIARAKFRLRGAGYEDQWTEDDGSFPNISFENLPGATECPFCKRQPVIKAFEWDRGCRIGPEPYILNQFQLKCCGWIAPVTFDSPVTAIESWNSKLKTCE